MKNINSNDKSSLKKIPGLDGLRAIAVIGVILYHLFPSTIKGGFLGVSLFFVLSGYLISITSENSWSNKKFSIIDFYKKRIKRIYPSLIIVVLLTAGLLKILAPNVLNGIKEELLSVFLGYNNLWQISQNASYFTKISNASPFTHMWSLSIELQYYLIWPFLFMLYKFMNKSKSKNLGIRTFLNITFISCLFMPILAKPSEDFSRIYYGTDTRIFSLLLGASLGLIQKNKTQHKLSIAIRKKEANRFWISILILFISFIYMDAQNILTYKIGMLALSLVFCIIIKVTTNSQLPIGRLLNIKPLTWIGKRSYEIYLWQYPVIFIFNYLNWGNSLLSSIIQFIVIILLASWLYSFVSIKKYKYIHIKIKQSQNMPIIVKSIMLFILLLGAFGIFTAPNKNDLSQLQQELEQNTILLQQQFEENSSQSQQETEENSSELQQEAEQDNSQLQQEVEINDQSLNFVTIIGDSVTLGASPSIKKALPNSIIYAKESQQVAGALDIIRSLDNQNQLGNTIVLALGTNAAFSEEIGQSLIDYLGEDRQIYWINVHGQMLQWQSLSNDTINLLANKNHNVTVLDWNSVALMNPQWFYDDGIHLNMDGQEAYANFIYDNIK